MAFDVINHHQFTRDVDNMDLHELILNAGLAHPFDMSCELVPNVYLDAAFDDPQKSTTSQLLNRLTSSDLPMMRDACKRLCHLLASGSLHRPTLADSLHLVLRAFSAADVELHTACRTLLQHLCQDDELVLRISEAPMGPAVLVEMLDNPPDVDMVDTVLHTILFLCCNEGTGQLQRCEDRTQLAIALLELVREELEQRTAYHIIHRPIGNGLLEAVPQGIDSLRALVVTMYKLSLIERYRRQMAEAGGIEICTLLLRTDEPANRIVTLQILYNLMVDNSVEFVVLGGIPPLVCLMGSKVFEECSMAIDMSLRLFELRGDIPTVAAQMVHCGALPLALALLQKSTPLVKQNALRLLCNVVQNGPEDYVLAISQEEGAVEGVLALLKYDEPEVQGMSTAFLWLLCQQGTGEVPDRIIQKGGVPLLQRLRNSLDATVRHNAIGCLKCLECFDGLDEFDYIH